MSSDFTDVDRPYGQQPATRAAAVAYLTRTGNADVIAALGLDDKEPPVVDGRPACPTCGRPRLKAKRAGYQPCRRELCSGGAG